MKTKVRTVHQCDHCNRKMFVKSAMEKHEKWCSKNPANFTACSGCVFLKETTIEYTAFYHNPYGETEVEKTAKSFKCEKLDKVLYPRIVQRKRLNTKYPETFEGQEPMPVNCEHMSFFN